MNEQTAQLDQARQIVAALAAIRDRLNPPDLRFVDTWEGYLEKAGAAAAIGKWRLHNLKTVAASYSIEVAELAAIGAQIE